MSRLVKSAVLAALCATATPVAAQLLPGEKPTEAQIAAGEAPATPFSEAETVYRGLSGTMVARQWPRMAAEDLLAYINGVHREGLEPTEYGIEELRAALASNNPVAIDHAATDSFLKLSAALALGTVPMESRTDWHFKDEDLDGAGQFGLMEKAIAAGSVAEQLDSLLPTHLQYAELKQVLAKAEDQETIDAARVNLERWRWLPRELGDRYVIVNVPAYTVALVEEGHVVARHKAIVGATKTPTPQLGAVATGVIFNPWWEVPASIADEVRGKKGFVKVKTGEGTYRYRQPPGPSNSLGRMKVVMPNNYAIYLHDTPAKSLFGRSARAMSHGCIRTQDPLTFARLLLENPEWDEAKIEETIASGKSVKAEGTIPTPVYIAYFTAAAKANGEGIVTYKDVYGRDDKVMASIKSGSTTAFAAAE